MYPLMLTKILQNLKQHNIDAYIINTNDDHLNEYIGPSDERLKHITGFTGSNGLILISQKQSYLYTDGRYHIQARKQLANSPFELVTSQNDFYEKCREYEKIGINTRQFTQQTLDTIKKINKNVVNHDIDEVLDLPQKKFNKLLDMETIRSSDYLESENLRRVVKKHFAWLDYDNLDLCINITGSYRIEKFSLLREKLKTDDVFLITALDEIAYLFNLRGNDIVFNPVFYSYAIISSDEAILFTEAGIELEGFVSLSYFSFEDHISQYTGKNILASKTCNAYIFEKLQKNNNVTTSTMISDMKSTKNDYELLGFILAHIYDGCALQELFEFMERELQINPNIITEKFITEKLVKIKGKYPGFFTPSFETISSTGSNSAIIHHTGDETPIKAQELYLIDSGSQYFYGTTDITRTACFVEPTKEQIEIFTGVLNQQLDVMLMNLPVEYPASALDAASRLKLWESKKDYEHSLGHGVGHFLNVHESPPSISAKGALLKNKMVFTFEPGFYIENKHGVRIEDVVVAVKEGKYFSFQPLSLCVLQVNLIDFDSLSKEKKRYVIDYNKKVNEILETFRK